MGSGQRRRCHYQPIVDVATSTCHGDEALVRWQHPDRGLVAPNSFIPPAEETGLIVPLGRWILDEACRTAMSFPHPGGVAAFVSVNASAVQLRRSNIVADVEHALGAGGPGADRLLLELTESTIIQDVDTVAADSVGCASAASGSRSTTSAPASPRSAGCERCRST